MKRALLVTATLLTLAPPHAHAQMGVAGTMAAGLITGVTVGKMLDDLEETANNLMESAKNGGQMVAFNAATQALVVIQALRQALGGNLNQTLDKLNAGAYDALHNTAYVLQLGIDGAQTTLDQGESIINQINNLTRTLPFVKQQATISHYGPLIWNAALTNNLVTLNIRGFGLDYGNTHIVFRDLSGKELYVVDQPPTTSNSIKVVFDGSKLPFSRTKLVPIEAIVTLKERTGFLGSLKKRQFKFSYFLLPEVLGTVVFKTKYGIQTKRDIPHMEFVHRNSKSGCQDFPFSPGLDPNGNPNRVDVKPEILESSKLDGTAEIGGYEPSLGRFFVKVCANGHTNFFRNYDGWYHGYVKWIENSFDLTEAEDTVSKELRFAGNQAFDVKDPDKAFSAEITTFDGNTYTVTKGMVSKHYFTSLYDPTSKKMIIEAKTDSLQSLLGEK